MQWRCQSTVKGVCPRLVVPQCTWMEVITVHSLIQNQHQCTYHETRRHIQVHNTFNITTRVRYRYSKKQINNYEKPRICPVAKKDTMNEEWWTERWPGCLLGGVYVPCIYRMPSRVIVGDSGLCCCGPAFNVWRQLFETQFPPIVCWLYEGADTYEKPRICAVAKKDR